LPRSNQLQRQNQLEFLNNPNQNKFMEKNHYELISGVNKIWKSQFFRKMRIVALLFLISVIQTFALDTYAQNKRINLNIKNETIENILKKIEDQSEFYFMFDASKIKVNERKSVDVENKLIDNILDELFEDTEITYSIRDRQILLSATENSDKAQQKSVSGIVTDQSGEPLPGVAVVVKGTTQGTATDVNGKYVINIFEDATLQFSFMGMISQEIEVKNNATINVTMQMDAIGLEEVVAIGYGVVRKSDLTGAVSSVNSKIITERGNTSPVQSLQGSVAGVQVSSQSGVVGESFSVEVRGKNTFSGSSSPLYVVNGAIVDNIDFLNPQDIEKIDILKDASSVAIYGSRGSNGVVIVTTKGGENSNTGTTVSVDSYYGMKSPVRYPEMMDAEEFLNFRKAHTYGRQKDPESLTQEKFYDIYAPPAEVVKRQRFADLESFDWIDAIIKNGYQTNNSINVTHNNGESSYVLGIGYQDETGLTDKERLQKYTIHSSINQKVGKKFTAHLSTNISFLDRQAGNNYMHLAFRMNPFLNPWKIDENNQSIVGEYNNLPGKLYNHVTGKRVLNFTSFFNPLLDIANTDNQYRTWTNTVNASLKYDFLSWISAKTTLSAYSSNVNQGRSFGIQTANAYKDGKSESDKTHSERFRYSWDNQINVNKKINKHSVNFLALQSLFVNRYETSSLGSREQPFETQFYNIGSGNSETFTVGSTFSKNQLMSFALRLNYSFNDKYLLKLTDRWDGSSVFPEGNKWSSFPSVAVAWRVTEEQFLSQFDKLSNLKLRLSYGQTGNNSIGSYATVNNLTSQAYYNFGSTSANGWFASSIANKALVWEKTKEFNFAVDYGFFNNRINGSFDIYNRMSDELLVSQKLPIETGFGAMPANAGSVKNAGFEISLGTVNIKQKNVRWYTDFTFSSNKNTVESIYGQSIADDIGNNLFLGQSIDVCYNYEMDGVWQINEAEQAAVYNQNPGEARVIDVNNDGKIDPDDDRVFLGSADPSFTYGLTSRLEVLNFDFNISMYGVQGKFIRSPWHAEFHNTNKASTRKANVDFYMPECLTSELIGQISL
jgi:TonB-linked SusC/RagA family outer membrane protein